MKKMRFFTAKNIAYLAALTALIVVLQAALGTIAIGPVTLNFSLIPIVLGALLLGPLAGLFLGFVCGLIVLIQVITGMNPFYELIWAESPVVTTLTCLFKTMVAADREEEQARRGIRRGGDRADRKYGIVHSRHAVHEQRPFGRRRRRGNERVRLYPRLYRDL